MISNAEAFDLSKTTFAEAFITLLMDAGDSFAGLDATNIVPALRKFNSFVEDQGYRADFPYPERVIEDMMIGWMESDQFAEAISFQE